MKPDYPMKEIAYQAGVSLATVDRVLHGRGGVRASTVDRVRAAIGELQRQTETALQSGRRFTIDVVMEAPQRFSGSVQKAFEAEMPAMRPATFRCRFHLAETMEESEICAILAKIRKRGSHGVVLKAPNSAEITASVGRLTRKGIPVVTLVTDIPDSGRLAYVGLDNREAGRTAAYFILGFLKGGAGPVLVSLSSTSFFGEKEREQGFREVLAQSANPIDTVSISEGFGKDRTTGAQVAGLIKRYPDICAIYSIGGGNRAIANAFKAAGKGYSVFVGHDLDRDNIDLLRQNRLSLVIHHDLRQDARSACQLILRHQRLLPASFDVAPSTIGIATPFNLPVAV
ncbi:LacI family DNA-binding transcriptional regulator [Hoeflea sp. TYP-13]|uniref:LacI family DNA-binding transcriptional regulator n=1 Tax=Hoeflea sp. TYP-13 TaxID=3230023 RepID=UPI0034C5B4B9